MDNISGIRGNEWTCDIRYPPKDGEGFGLGIRGVHVHSSIADEGDLVKTSPLQGLGSIHSS